MERKEINAISIEELKAFLIEKGIFDKFEKKDYKCEKCSKQVTFDNIVSIGKKNNEYVFRCNCFEIKEQEPEYDYYNTINSRVNNILSHFINNIYI